MYKMELQEWQLERFIEYARNPRKNDHAVDRIASAIKEFGFRVPIVAKSDGLIVDGHLRLKAARKLGMTTVPVILADDLTDAQIKAFRISVNRMAEFAEWDDELLKLELEELKSMDFDLSLTGFEDFDFTGKKGDQKRTEENDVPDAPKVIISVPGDIWILGDHRIMCGSSTDPEHVEKLLDGATPGLMVTDPPYGVNYSADWRMKLGLNGDGGAFGKVENDDLADWTPAWELFIEHGGVVCYVWHAGSHSPLVADSLFSVGLEMRNLIIWAKNQIAISRGNYHHQHEPCWYAVKKGESARFTEDRTQSTLWKNIDDILRPGELVFVARDEARKVYAIRGDRSTLWQIPKPSKSETGHSTQKPVECMERPMRNHDFKEVYEPFSGSGTTIIAAEKMKRRCYAMEISPEYVDLAVKRWQDFTGKLAVHEQTGKGFGA